jgi:LPS-assembly protein
MNSLRNYIQIISPRIEYSGAVCEKKYSGYSYDGDPSHFAFHNLLGSYLSSINILRPCNKISAGFTTSIYDKHMNNRFGLSLSGDRSFFPFTPMSDHRNAHSVLSGKVYWNIHRSWGVNSDIKYDPSQHQVFSGRTVIEYNHNDHYIAQLNYNYDDLKYMNRQIPASRTISRIKFDDSEKISQLGLVLSWPISKSLSILGNYYYDTDRKNAISQLLKLQYQTSCYTISVEYNRQAESTEYNQNVYYGGVSLKISLRGLNDNYRDGFSHTIPKTFIPYQKALITNFSLRE